MARSQPDPAAPDDRPHHDQRAGQELPDIRDRIGDLEAAAERLAAVLRSLADRYVQACLTGTVSDTRRAIAEELAGAFHTLAGALGSRPGPGGDNP
jgi:hypothetical protein